MEFGIVELSHLPFATTAMNHFLVVLLTYGLIAIMATVHLMTNRPIWRQVTKYGERSSGSILSPIWPPVAIWLAQKVDEHLIKQGAARRS